MNYKNSILILILSFFVPVHLVWSSEIHLKKKNKLIQIAPHLRFAGEYDYSNDSGLNINDIPVNKNQEGQRVIYQFRNAYLTLQGALNKKVRYFLMPNFLTNTLDDAYIDYRLTKNTRLRIGKFFLGSGTFERLERLVNVPYYTMGNNAEFGLNRKEGVAFVFMPLIMNKIMLSISNGNKERNQLAPMYGIAWNGQYLNQRLQLLCSYHIYHRPKQFNSPTNVENSLSGKDQYIGLGLKLSTAKQNLSSELGSMYNVYQKRTNERNDTLLSSYVQLVGEWKKMRLILKSDYSKYTRANVEFKLQKGGSVALEIFTSKKKEFKFFGQYAQFQENYYDNEAPTLTTGAKIKGTIVGMKNIQAGVILDF